MESMNKRAAEQNPHYARYEETVSLPSKKARRKARRKVRIPDGILPTFGKKEGILPSSFGLIAFNDLTFG